MTDMHIFIILLLLATHAAAYLLGRQGGYDHGWDDSKDHERRKRAGTAAPYQRVAGPIETTGENNPITEAQLPAVIIEAKTKP